MCIVNRSGNNIGKFLHRTIGEGEWHLLKDMPAIFKYFDLSTCSGSLNGFRKSRTVVEQNLISSDLNIGGRESGEITEERAESRIFRIPGTGYLGIPDGYDEIIGQDGILLLISCIGF